MVAAQCETDVTSTYRIWLIYELFLHDASYAGDLARKLSIDTKTVLDSLWYKQCKRLWNSPTIPIESIRR
jgi:hypothetical protein